MDFDRSLGNMAAAWRISAGLTQQTLGAAVGLDQATISRIESGDRKVDVDLLLQILAATGQSLPDVASDIQELAPARPSLWKEQ
ncbi:helix-turn-helix domain-containing protein [Arthrobacter sedimenti]|uniref:Helix-turn-helix domain-containing protein n=1 Tax=Arthrobacter sedimenti TaxID=2694931 RepID=A0ABV8WHK7_9MICC